MKKLLFLLALALMPGMILFSQSPQAFKYQAIARDAAGNILINNPIGLRISMVEGNKNGIAKYIESHTVKSNPFGVINIVIGEGNKEKGDFEEINWGEDSYFVKLEMDIKGGTDYKEMGATQLYAVPYALYAEQAGNLMKPETNKPASVKTSQQKKSKSSGGNRSGTPNTKFSATGNNYTNVPDGNLGVGTYEPTEKLEVIGNIKASGRMISDGPLIMYDDMGNPRELTINPDGTWDMKFLCEGIIRDVRNGREYKIIKIGDQCWMAENLNIGDRIAGITNQSNNDFLEKYCFADLETNCDVYGGMYQWNEMMQYEIGWENRGICPFSWHIPSGDEMDLLVDFLGGAAIAGSALKETGFEHWLSTNTDATNSSGFTAFGAGERMTSGGFHRYHELGSFWSATDDGASSAYRMTLTHNHGLAQLINVDTAWGFSVRCIKDFECGDSIIDHRDGRKYGSVLIGKQCWMSQNINFGSMIPGVNDQVPGTDEKYCYDDLEVNCDTYGGLYQWDEMMQYVTDEGTKGICPEGFHIPTDVEWKVLEGNVDSRFGLGVAEWNGTGFRGYDVGYRLKSTTGWFGDGNGSDLYGFALLPGGHRDVIGLFFSIGEGGYYWSSSVFDVSNAWERYLFFNNQDVLRTSFYRSYGYNVRCLKNN